MGAKPTGEHKCVICCEPVHLLLKCSYEIEGEENYGQKRKCTNCTKKTYLRVKIMNLPQQRIGSEEFIKFKVSITFEEFSNMMKENMYNCSEKKLKVN